MMEQPAAPVPVEEQEGRPQVASETGEVEFTFVVVNYQGKSLEVQWPSQAAIDLGLVACTNGHPNMPNPASGEISCGCGSTEEAS